MPLSGTLKEIPSLPSTPVSIISAPRLKDILKGISRESELPDIIAVIKKNEPTAEVSVPILTGADTIGMVTVCLSQHDIRNRIAHTVVFVIALNLIVAIVLGSRAVHRFKKGDPGSDYRTGSCG